MTVFHTGVALGENSKASPTRRCTILLKREAESFSASPFFWLSFSGKAAVAFVEENGLSEAPAMWFFNMRSHSGDVKRWTIVTEHRLSNVVEIVGSWVEMITRAAR